MESDVMKRLTLVAGLIGAVLTVAIAADAAARNLVPNPRGGATDASLHLIELFDCSPCSKGGPCPKVCATSPPPKPSQSSGNTHGCACLHNETGQAINFRYHWGQGDWTKVNMKPGFQYSVCWRYAAGSHASPALQFELDVDMSKGNAWKTYSITRVQSPGNSCSIIPGDAHYTVKYRPNTNNQFIEVYKRKS
jgi:hypothetical protein